MKNSIKDINIVNISLCLIPLLVPSYCLINAVIILLSMAILHFLVVISMNYINKFLKDNRYYNLIALALPITIVIILGIVSTLIFMNKFEFIINLLPYILSSELLLCLLYRCNSDIISDNLQGYCRIMLKFAVVLPTIAFVRELVGLVSLFNKKLPIANFEGIAFFRHAASGILLLAIITAVFTILNKKEEK